MSLTVIPSTTPNRSRTYGGAMFCGKHGDRRGPESLVRQFGAIEESHLAAVEFARPYFEIPVGRRFRTVLTSAAGYPLDRNYYQTVKGMVGVCDILEPDANLFVVSECSEGLGMDEFAGSQARMITMGIESFFEESAQKQYASIDEWESIMQVKAMRMATSIFTAGCSAKTTGPLPESAW